MTGTRTDTKRRLLAKLLGSTLAEFHGDEVAIVGLAGRYPEAPTLSQFWANLVAGRESIRELPRERFDWRPWYDATPNEGRIYTARAGVIEHADAFDPLFFNISPREARAMDPQERVFLEVAWAALEDAGHAPSGLVDARVGVFVGAMNHGYASLGATAWTRGHDTGAHTAFWSIANRLSYLCNFRGPSLAIDTACSASLTAIHLACESLRRGECELAIAGGVNLITHPLQLIGLCGMGMLSPSGHCHSFGAGADGFVDGEGAGAVVLRPLAHALVERDHVWAVIRGSSINAGGKTGGYTVPNPHAQATCIRDALARARVDPRTISYVEAHGTGTALGDPIEVAALDLVFGHADTPVRALGSVKANVGHLESAAGVCGLTRVLLQLQHRTLAPSIHADPPNERVAFARSSLFVVRRAQPWSRPIVDGREQPLRAGISSFGAGGANAHLIVEELLDPLHALEPTLAPPFVLLLSARDDVALTRRAADLRDALATLTDPTQLGRLCFTLACGREPMAVRLAIVGHDHAQLGAALDAAASSTEHPSLERGRVERGGPRDSAPSPALRVGLDELALWTWARWWLRGGEIDWRAAYPSPPPRRMSLPSYPFARERYSIAAQALDGLGPRADTLELRVAADDWRLTEHRVHGRELLPAAATIELLHGLAPGSRIESLELLAPIHADDDGVTLTVARESSEPDWLELRQHRQTCVRARLRATSDRGPQVRVDIEQVRARLAPIELDPYPHFRAAGLEHGPRFALLRELWVGEGECLARLDHAEPGHHRAEMTALLDAALQSVFVLLDGRDGALLPRAIDRVRWSGDASLPAWVHVQARAGSFDLELIDAHARPLAELRGLVFAGAAARRSATETTPLLLTVDRLGPVCATVHDAVPRVALVLTRERSLLDALAHHRPDLTCIHVEPGAGFRTHGPQHLQIDPDSGHDIDALIDRLTRLDAIPEVVLDGLADSTTPTDEVLDPHARLLLRLLTAWQRAELAPPRLVSWARAATPDQLALAAMFASVAAEWPGFGGRVAILEPSCELLDALLDELSDATTTGIVTHAEGRRCVPRMRAISLAATIDESARSWLITGGAGGLGSMLARRLARRPGARLLLCGRSPLSPELAAELARLRACGAAADYRRCDVQDADDVQALITACVDAGGLDGIIHAAGVLDDARLLDKPEPELERVIAVKRRGALLLDRASRALPLRHFVLCGSLAGLFGNAGQVDYAYANAWLDHFAHERERLRALGLRSGRTCTIDWPPIHGGGMQLSAATLARLERQLGVRPLDEHGCGLALDAALAAEVPQLIPLDGDLARLRAVLLESDASARAPGRSVVSQASPRPAARASISTPDRRHAARALLVEVLGEVLELPPDRIDVQQRIDAYGVDSISSLALARALEQRLGPVSRTLFLEYTTIDEIAAHLADEHPHAFEPNEPAPNEPAPVEPSETPLPTPRAPRPRATPVDDDPIAIVAMAGRFPGAPSLDELWQLLHAGRSSITEVPSGRWDIHAQPQLGSHHGAFLDDIDCFDHALFGLTRIEAAALDPAERLFLQLAWQTFEQAGWPRARRLASQRGEGNGIGVYAACMYRQYAELAVDARTRGLLSSGSYWSIANRTSWFFDLHGPSLALDNACASSLSALDLACCALARGDCGMALVGAVNLSLTPYKHAALALMGLTTPGATPRLFGGGDGFVIGEGAAMVLLEPLSRARANGDRVLACISASACNHGGRTAGFSVPDTTRLADVACRALTRAGLSAAQLDVLELAANGSGIGDAIEQRALVRVCSARERPIPVSSVKAAIGHLEAASGLAQLIKVVLQMQRRELLPSLPHSSDRAAAAANLDPAHFELIDAPRPWTASAPEQPLRAGLIGFGAGGANACVIVESVAPPDVDPPAPRDEPQLFRFSAFDGERLRAWVERIIDHVEREQPPAPALARALLTRERLPERLAVVARSSAQLLEQLRRWLLDPERAAVVHGRAEQPDPAFTGPEAAAFVRTLVDNERWQQLAHLWVRGVEPDSTPLHADPRHAAIELPSYPFARVRCWLDPAASTATSSSGPRAPDLAPLESLRALLAELLERPIAAIDDARPLSDYGIDSMLGSFLLAGVGERLHVHLPLAVLGEVNTLAQLAERVAAAGPDFAPEFAPGSAPARGSARLLELQRGDELPPSVWVHGAPGFAFVFRQLPQVLGPARPIYAFEARGLDDSCPPFANLPAQIDHYLELLLATRPRGPYLLGGYSLGGLIALQLAERLRARGHELAGVVMFDTLPLDAELDELGLDEARIKLLIANLFVPDGTLPDDALDGVPPALHDSRLTELILARGRTIVPARELYRYLRGAFAVAMHHGAALRGFVPERLDGVDVLFVRAGQQRDGTAITAARLAARVEFWQRHVERPLRVLDLPTHHFDLLDARWHPHLRDELARLSAPATSPRRRTRRRT